VEGVRAILGDTGDPAFPIYRVGDAELNSTDHGTVLTLCTVVWDAQRGTMSVWTGNPAVNAGGSLQFVADLRTLSPAVAAS